MALPNEIKIAEEITDGIYTLSALVEGNLSNLFSNWPRAKEDFIELLNRLRGHEISVEHAAASPVGCVVRYTEPVICQKGVTLYTGCRVVEISVNDAINSVSLQHAFNKKKEPSRDSSLAYLYEFVSQHNGVLLKKDILP